MGTAPDGRDRRRARDHVPAPAPRWVLPVIALAGMLGGLTSVGIFCIKLSMPELGTTAACIVGFFGLAILRLLPTQAALAVTPYFVFDQWALVNAFTAGRLGGVRWIAFMAGLMVCVTIDRVTRASYRQERILEAQREVIDRLQRAELQRQVAARSRVLSEALTRFCDAPRTPMPLAPGDIIDERYRIVRAVGKGGMGQVHEVERLTDGRRLALKTLTGVAHREALAGFAREAQVAAELQHPNVVATLDIGVTRSGMLFFVMELVAGASLAAERSRHALLGGLRRAGSARRKGACARLRAARRTIRSGDRKVPIRSLTGRMSIDSVSSLS